MLGCAVVLIAGGCSTGSGSSSSSSTAAHTSSAPDATAPAQPTLETSRSPQAIVSVKLSAEPCTLDGPEISSDRILRTIGPVALASDGTVYLLDNQGKTRRYRSASGPGCTLRLDEGFGTGGILDTTSPSGLGLAGVAADREGHVVVSMQFGSKRITGNRVDYECSDSGGEVALHPAGKVGYSPFGKNHRLQRITFSDQGCTVDNLELGDAFETFAGIGFADEQLYVGGYNVVDGKQGPHQLRQYGPDGSTIGPLLGGSGRGDEVLCDVGRIVNCRLGVCVFDDSCQAIRIWTKAGDFVRAVDLEELLGVDQPRVVGISDTHEGKAYATAATRRARREYVGQVFRITGL